MAKRKVGYASYRYSHLKRITAAAKKLRKAHPKMQWTDAIAKASKKVSGIRKHRVKKVRHTKRAHKVKRVRRVTRVGAVTTAPSYMSTAQMVGAIRAAHKQKLGKLYVQRDFAANKRTRNKIQKQITETKIKINKYK